MRARSRPSRRPLDVPAAAVKASSWPGPAIVSRSRPTSCCGPTRSACFRWPTARPTRACSGSIRKSAASFRSMVSSFRAASPRSCGPTCSRFESTAIFTPSSTGAPKARRAARAPGSTRGSAISTGLCSRAGTCTRSKSGRTERSSAASTGSPSARPSSARACSIKVTDASKVGLDPPCRPVLNAGGSFCLLDTQFVTDHLATFGGMSPCPKHAYHQLLWRKAVSRLGRFLGCAIKLKTLTGARALEIWVQRT